MFSCKNSILALSIVGVFSTVAHADDQANDNATIVVTGSLEPKPLNKVVGDVQVITAKDLKRFVGQNVTDVLADVAQIQIRSSGGIGQQTSFFVRGASAKQVLVLVDGVPYSSLTVGGAALQSIPVASIERIEVLEGAAGALYGSDAVGGVIQIFTKTGKAKPSAQVTVAAGTQDSQQLGAQLNTGILNSDLGQTSIGFGLNTQRTDGINVVNGQPDLDGYKDQAINLSLQQKFNEKNQAGVTVLDTHSRVAYDNPQNSYGFAHNGAYGLWYGTQLGGNFKLKLNAGQTVDDYDAKAGYIYQAKSTQNLVNALASYQLAKTQLQLGTSHVKQNVSASTAYTVSDRTINSVYTGATGQIEALDWQANLRHDDNSQYGSNNTYRFGLGLQVSPSWRVLATRGTAFRAPNFGDLYYPKYGNPNLKPEESQSTDATLQFKNAHNTTKLIGFYNKVDNLIGYDASYNLVNVDKAILKGATLKTDWNYDTLRFGGQLDDTQATNDSGINKGKQLARRAKYQGLAYVGQNFTNWQWRVEAQAQSKNYNDPANKTTVHGYVLANAYAAYHVTPSLNVSLRVNNLFDTNYTQVYGYNTLGVNGLLALSYTWH